MISRFLVPKKTARTKQMARKSNKGLPKATKGAKGGKGSEGGVSSGRSGGSSGGGGGAVGGSDGNRKVPSGRFIQELKNRPPAAVPKWKKPYVRAFQEMRKLQHTTKLCILKYQMAR